MDWIVEVFHGSKANFEKFDNSKIGSGSRVGDKIGHFLTKDIFQAKGFAGGFLGAEGIEPYEKGAMVYTCKVTYSNPLTYGILNRVLDIKYENIHGGMIYEENKEKIENLMISGSYDSLIINDLIVVPDGSQIEIIKKERLI